MNNRQQLVQESVWLLGMPVSPGTLKNRQGLVVHALDQFVKKIHGPHKHPICGGNVGIWYRIA